MTAEYAVTRLRYAWARAREEGLAWTVRELLLRGARIPVWLLLLPITLIAHVAGFRRLPVITGRIGHLAAEVDCFLKLRALGRLPARHWFILAPAGQVANETLADYWRPHVRLVTHPLACTLIDAATRWGPARHTVTDFVMAVTGPATYYRVNAEWADRVPILTLSRDDQARGRKALQDLGIPEGAWYVCVHARGPGYSPADERMHWHRNSDAMRLLPAIDAIVERGGWCIRMGDPSMPRLPPRRGLVDYAHHSLRSAFLDVFFCASCRFFLGNSSGLFIVSTAFGRPSALANVIPLATLGFAPGDLSIPKLLWSRRHSRLLRFDEVMASPLSNARASVQYRDANVEPVENTADEIADLAREMLDRTTSAQRADEAPDPLSLQFNGLIQPWHYCYGAGSNVAGSFLRRHRELLPWQQSLG